MMTQVPSRRLLSAKGRHNSGAGGLARECEVSIVPTAKDHRSTVSLRTIFEAVAAARWRYPALSRILDAAVVHSVWLRPTRGPHVCP
jgi:hypothetical protein